MYTVRAVEGLAAYFAGERNAAANGQHATEPEAPARFREHAEPSDRRNTGGR